MHNLDPFTEGGELTHSYSVEEGGESKMTKAELITMIEHAGFEAVERDTVYNRVDTATTGVGRGKHFVSLVAERRFSYLIYR